MEKVSEKRKRGRPRVVEPSMATLTRQLEGSWLSDRTVTNRHYFEIAYHVVQAAIKDGETELDWLIRGDSPRLTLLTELGRLEHPGDILVCARLICQAKPTTERGVVFLRRTRLPEREDAPVDQLVSALARVVDRYRARYPEIDRAAVLEGLAELEGVVRSIIPEDVSEN